VLVDEQGKSKSVEIDDSSGSEALDRAAAEAIKRWRFSPARYGNKSVESWVKIPIDFRLTDAQN
jgi:protein TonB